MATNSDNKSNSNCNFLNNSDDEEESNYVYTFQLIGSCALPTVLKVVIEMGVLQMIHDHQVGTNGLSPAKITTGVQIRNPGAPAMLDRMLRLLATYSVVECTASPSADGGVKRRYSPTPDDDGVSLAALLNLFMDNVFLDSWSKLKEAIMEGGIPFNMVHGMHAFEYPGVDPRFNEVFNKAMFQTTTFIVKKIMKKYKGLENIHQLVDVGGGLGHSLGVITSQYPSIKGINFDLPHVIEKALSYPDEPNTTESSRAISQSDLYMMTQNPGGKERSKQEFEALSKAARYANVKLDCCVYNFRVMELYK